MTIAAAEGTLVERLRDLLERASPLPWCWEQCGEKCDAPVVGAAWRIDDPDCKPLAGCVESYDEDGNEVLYVEGIATEIEGQDGRSASANAALMAEGLSALPTLLARISALEKALGESRGAVQAFLDMVNVIQKWQALPIPAILETAQHNCPIILANIDQALTGAPE